jgi:hypothetical protein
MARWERAPWPRDRPRSPRLLAFRWRELRTGDAGLAVADATVVAFTLEADARGTRVTVTESPGVLGSDGPLAMAEHA